MKKIMTILLSLTMCLCFVCTKANVVEADSATLNYEIWYDYQAGLSKIVSGNSSSLLGDSDKSAAGLDFNSTDRILTLSKDLIGNGDNKIINVTGNKSLTIKLSSGVNSITIKGSGNNYALDANSTIIIDGDGKTMIVDGNGYSAINTGSNGFVKLNNVKCTFTSSIGGGATVDILDLTINENAECEIINTGTGNAINVYSEPTIPEGYEILGTVDGSKTNLQPATYSSNNYTYVIGSVSVKYLTIRKIQPQVAETTVTSVSAPVYKDESCEAVIGPRWHWNNTKGVCEEEYSVINTATK